MDFGRWFAQQGQMPQTEPVAEVTVVGTTPRRALEHGASMEDLGLCDALYDHGRARYFARCTACEDTDDVTEFMDEAGMTFHTWFCNRRPGCQP